MVTFKHTVTFLATKMTLTTHSSLAVTECQSLFATSSLMAGLEAKQREVKQHYQHLSLSLDDVRVEEKRGFVPSDVRDPGKREFLVQLSRRMWSKAKHDKLTRGITAQKIRVQSGQSLQSIRVG